MKTQRLGKIDWINAGYRALVAGGAAALRVEPVARSLGATKGSFYWHFAGPDDWREAMLDHWQDRGFAEIVTHLSALPAGAARLRALVGIALNTGRDPAHGGPDAELALRDWGRFDAKVAAAVHRVDAQRTAYVMDELRVAGVGQPETAACLFYAAYLGTRLQNLPTDAAVMALHHLMDLLGLPLRGRPGPEV
jgi:AcrR family transcriptional regulator